MMALYFLYFKRLQYWHFFVTSTNLWLFSNTKQRTTKESYKNNCINNILTAIVYKSLYKLYKLSKDSSTLLSKFFEKKNVDASKTKMASQVIFMYLNVLQAKTLTALSSFYSRTYVACFRKREAKSSVTSSNR